jgi:hypothetical protein
MRIPWISRSTAERSDNSHPHIPGYLKIIILAQAATLLSLTVWMYQEYLNDPYFQQYVISIFQSNIIADALLSIVTVSVFSLGTFIVLGSMGTSRKVSKEWRVLSEEARAPHFPTLPVLEVVERPSKARSTSRRPRQRKPRADTEKIYDSMRHFRDDQEQQ